LILGSLGSALAGTGIEYQAMNCRKHSAVLTDFGGVDDGKTSNTKALKKKYQETKQVCTRWRSTTYCATRKIWLTGSFNLTSHFTLFLHKDAVLLASRV